MSRETFVWRNGKVIPKDNAPPARSRVGGVMPDIVPFVTQDKTEISSRSGLRAYEQRTGTRQIGNDYAGLARTLNRGN